MRFQDFFSAATKHPEGPFDYQCRLAVGSEPKGGCKSLLVNVPTGLGKTAAVVLAWLWNRVALGREDWPRRLVYCLPMRTLVEQTQDEIEGWLKNLSEKADELGLGADARKELLWLREHSPVVLMGGEELEDAKAEWDIYPERACILIGTQDMLLSRALNRGYGMSRCRWPMHFGLLNNDCLWVLDETQLIGVGVRTSAQLEGLRQKLGVAAPSATWWASATLDARLLETPDHSGEVPALSLEEEDWKSSGVSQRLKATKRLSKLPFSLSDDSAKAVEPYLEKLAASVLANHQPGTTTIVILNRVARARELFALLEKKAKKQTLPERLLVHSRFRPLERELLLAKMKAPGEKIIIATQAIEAGVDISARTLFTELAPWSSLVQRFGRCNRKGEFNNEGGADVFWVDLQPETEKGAEALALPYLPEQLAAARTLLETAQSGGVSPAALEKFSSNEPLASAHILRRKDLVELFDTTPDLAGLDIDVGRFIRDEEERDAQVFWREFAEDGGPDERIEPLRRELVRVSLGALSGFLKENRGRVWTWSVLGGQWQKPERVGPGQIYLVHRDAGGYSEKLGWTGKNDKERFGVLSVEAQPKRKSARDGQGRDAESLLEPERIQGRDEFQSLEQHTAKVVESCRILSRALPASAPWSGALLAAATWHDVGKAHPCFQAFITEGRKDIPERLRASFIAKAPWRAGARHQRPHFRHELASALAWLGAGGCADPFTQSLVAYLVAAHHGKVRLSIRAMPGEKEPGDASASGEKLFARGIWNGERLPGDGDKKLTLEGFPATPVVLDLSCMRMGEQTGRPSWTARALSLRDEPQLGVFRLVWLETLLRGADAQASKR